MSIACQNQVDVCSPGNLRGAVNIYTMVLEKGKGPGERY
ncbi:YfjI family protein [Escherichia coli]|nr:YfjI family protein [Escherichia coli]MCT6334480.1 YfjI family protein [Escherichia coli]MCW9913779.1 YfjI family protein [Escherichia coli]MDT1223540.1 YfjI family protein [Escherichia coli]